MKADRGNILTTYSTSVLKREWNNNLSLIENWVRQKTLFSEGHFRFRIQLKLYGDWQSYFSKKKTTTTRDEHIVALETVPLLQFPFLDFFEIPYFKNSLKSSRGSFFLSFFFSISSCTKSLKISSFPESYKLLQKKKPLSSLAQKVLTINFREITTPPNQSFGIHSN